MLTRKPKREKEIVSPGCKVLKNNWRSEFQPLDSEGRQNDGKTEGSWGDEGNALGNLFNSDGLGGGMKGGQRK